VLVEKLGQASLSKSCDNGREWGVRNIKVKQKVNGCFRTDAGADIYMKLHSLTDMAKKNGSSRFNVLLTLVDMQR
jgi:hypothetical protein